MHRRSPFDFNIKEINDHWLSGNDDDGEVWQISRNHVVMWREKAIKAKKVKK